MMMISATMPPMTNLLFENCFELPIKCIVGPGGLSSFYVMKRPLNGVDADVQRQI